MLLLIFLNLANAKTFKVFHNTLDPAVFGTTGGAHHNATGDGIVDALSICIRFQVMSLKLLPSSLDLIKDNSIVRTLSEVSFRCSLPTWLAMTTNGRIGARSL